MALIGLLLALVILGVSADVVYENANRVGDASVFAMSLGHMSTGRVFGAGFFAGLAFVLSIALVAAALGRMRRVRRERRAAIRAERERAESLRLEKERLEQQLEAERTSAVPAYPDEPRVAPAHDGVATAQVARHRAD